MIRFRVRVKVTIRFRLRLRVRVRVRVTETVAVRVRVMKILNDQEKYLIAKNQKRISKIMSFNKIFLVFFFIQSLDFV